jgi:hypothetical protein
MSIVSGENVNDVMTGGLKSWEKTVLNKNIKIKVYKYFKLHFLYNEKDQFGFISKYNKISPSI